MGPRSEGASVCSVLGSAGDRAAGRHHIAKAMNLEALGLVRRREWLVRGVHIPCPILQQAAEDSGSLKLLGLRERKRTAH